ncbi:MAG TPA: ECF transporter S component [Anaerolineales bacterium]
MKKIVGVVVALLVILVIIVIGVYLIDPRLQFPLDRASVPLRFAFVGLGLLIAFGIYLATRQNKAWEVGTREVVWMAIGAALYAVFSWLFNGTVFVVPSLSQVSLRPAIAIPMFFGYAFGPVVGFFSGAVGNMFGDALTGFGLSPQWSIANGLVGLIAGLPLLFKDKKKSLDIVLIVGGVLAILAVALYFFNRDVINGLYFTATEPVSVFAALTIVIGFVLVLIVRFAFGKNIDIATAVTWAMLGNILGIGFAAISDIWINGYSPAAAIVGEFLPAAGPNLIFAAILVPLLVVAYAAVQRQSGR